MARIITINDDDTGVQATVTIDAAGTSTRITSIHLDAINGHSVTAQSLTLLASIGLTPPAVAAAGTPSPPTDPAGVHGKRPQVPTARRPGRDHPPNAATGTPPRAAYTITYGNNGDIRRPPTPVIIDAIGRVGAHPTALAEFFGIPGKRKTISNWLTLLRRSGAIPRTAAGERQIAQAGGRQA